jgi:hypothetical protein
MAKTDRQLKKTSQKQTSFPMWSLPVIFCAIAVRIAALIYDRTFTSYDDGVIAEGARLVLHGQIPYRDFWTMYTPGTFYVNALALACFGERIVSIRLFGLLLGALQAAIVYLIIKRTVRSSAGAVIAAAAYLALIPIGIQTYWVTALLAAVYSLVRFIEKPASRWCYLSGFFAGITLLFRQDSGAYLAVALFPLMLLASPEKGIKKVIPAVKAFAMIAVVVGSAVNYFAAHGALSHMIDSTVRFAVFGFPASRPLPYPVPWQEVLIIGGYSAPLSVAFFYQLFGFYLLPVALIVFSGLSIRRVLKSKDDRSLLIVASLFCIALLMILMVRVRPSGPRVMASAALCSIACAIMLSDKSRVIRVASISMLIMSIAAFVPFGVYTVWANRSYAPSIVAGRGGVYAARGHAESLSATAAKIKELTSPSEKILCGAPAIYFLSERAPVTRYYEPHPCVTDTPEVERAIIRDIEKNHMRYFIRSREWGQDSYFTIEPQHEPKALDNFIEKNYAIEFDYVLFQIYKRNTPFE